MMACLLGRGQVNLSLLSLRCAIATPNMNFFHLYSPPLIAQLRCRISGFCFAVSDILCIFAW